MDDKKVFSITESVIRDECCGTFYSPLSIKSYVNEEWVDDFQKIIDYKKKIDKEVAIGWAEDPKKTEQLKNDFYESLENRLAEKCSSNL